MSVELFNNRNAFATPLLLAAFDRVGMDLFDYEPETVSLFIKSIAPKAPLCNHYKLNAALGLFTTNLFWQDPVQFGIACRTFNRQARATAGEPTLEDMAWGITEANMLVGETSDTFSEAIKAYITYMMSQANLLKTPDAFEALNIKTKTITHFDDSEQQYSIQQRSDSDVAAIDYFVYVQMIEMLNQIRTLKIPFSKEASDQLNKILTSHEQNNSNIK